jgi:hypothetical protein
MVQMNDAAAKIAVKKDLHGACVRNGLRVPALSSKICTWKFLNQVRLHEVFVLPLKDVILSPCPQKPSEKVIREALIALIVENQHNMPASDVPRFLLLVEHLKKHTADKEFMLDMISTLTKGGHEFFDKSYQPPKRAYPVFHYQIQGDAAFFANLPNAAKNNPRAAWNLLTKAQKQEYKLQQLRRTAAAAQERLNAFQQGQH